MKRRRLFISLVIFTLLALLPGAIFFLTQPTAAQTDKSSNVKIKNKTLPKSPRIKKIISGAKEPKQIPDNVAYELFLRTVAEGNARALVKRTGLTDEQVEKVMVAAYSVNHYIESLDRMAKELKLKQTAATKQQTKIKLLDLQKKKEQIIAERVEIHLKKALSNEAEDKLEDFVETEVKGNLKKILVSDDSPQIKETAFIKTSLKRQNGGELYLYSAGWNDGFNVYGSGSLSEQYTSNTSYRATTTVISPSGRSNTTQSDWDYATVSNNTGLSIGIEDGTYQIQADFEEQSGYYDEWGNFYGGGISFIGSSTSIELVAPSINLLSATVTPNQFYLGGNPTGGEGEGDVIVEISASPNIPSKTTILFDLLEISNGTINNRVQYTVEPTTHTGNPPHPSSKRQVSKEISNSGQIQTLHLFDVTMVGTSTTTGTVVNEIRINKIITNYVNGTNDKDVLGENSSTQASFTLSPAPTPTPTSTPNNNDDGVGICSPECFVLNPGCCLGQGGEILGSMPSSCDTSPNNIFVKALYSPKELLRPPCNCIASPILIDVAGDGFAMTSAENGVPFDFNGDGIIAGKLAWTNADSDDAWLVLDRNQNNRIDNGQELFGNATPQPEPPDDEERQGFLALAEYDKPENGGDADGKITRSDTVFGKLRLWQDKNHNGLSEAEELSRLPALDIVAVYLDYKSSKKTDEHGNEFKYRAKVRDAKGAKAGRWAWDVFLKSVR